ncbi:hypothetical protein IQ264_00100 [Phormidium sp. LEGE 05292]|uniref:hypothetical protein n=1 Tax=[Phormidium] sp. LEGE 05292 TaxID=767427 RepID=UPI001882BDD1|nr:hypothetical protein [Phormidium sp. LEGE 05292]MBE9223879.1 hypothetical protein [Phormidium sp. LEGE 05292]
MELVKNKNNHQMKNSNEQIIYDHLINCVQNEQSAEIIERFHQLFIDGIGYPERDIEEALYKIIVNLESQQQFNYIISRCCYILINRWQMQPKSKNAIGELIELFENSSSRFTGIASRSRLVQRLQELTSNFTQSEEYKILRRLVPALTPRIVTVNQEAKYPLGQLISRYPFLYDHCLLDVESPSLQKQTVQEIQKQRQKQIEISLSQYTLYLLRQVKTAKQIDSEIGDKIIKPMKNPTLLTDEKLYLALQEFVGKVKDSYTYRDLAQDFLSQASQHKNYRGFKSYLYDYLIDSVEPKYGKHQFNNRLHQHLKNLFSDKDSQKLNEVLIMQTCSELFNFLVESPANPNYYLFLDLVANLGPRRTIGLLLKIALLSNKVKPLLERRFSILFSYYESQTVEDLRWLVQSLENLNVALVTNFGAVDVSFIKHSFN